MDNRELTRTSIQSNDRNTLRSKNNKKKHGTKKNKKSKKRSEMDHFRARMNLPIGSSSVSFPISDDVRKDIERYERDINQWMKDGLL